MYFKGGKIIKDLFLDIFWEILYFPVWWYSRGLKKTVLLCGDKIEDGWRVLALSILFVNFFKPMYGQRGWAAYLLSLNTHFWQLLWRLFLIVSWTIIWLLILFIWLGLPIFVIWQLII